MNRKFTAIYRIFICTLIITACKSKNQPDLGGIMVSVDVGRFDQALFSANLLEPKQALQDLQRRFPTFTDEFNNYILRLNSPGDSLSAEALEALVYFTNNYQPVFDSLKTVSKSIDQSGKSLEKAFKYIKYYFPQTEIPQVVAYLGPFDAPGIALTEHSLAIGTQLYGGKDFFFYKTPQGRELFPEYISRRFEASYIPVNATKAMLDDMLPQLTLRGALVDQIIAAGKQWYFLDLILPDTEDTLKTGFTLQQLKFCHENEGNIWNHILKSTDLYTSEPATIRIYIGDAPSTPGMPETSPGNLGQFIGRQIVKKYMEKFPDTSPEALANMDNRELFQKANYKPR